MTPLNQHEISWFNHNRQHLTFEGDSSPASVIYTAMGVHGIAQLHQAIIQRSLRQIQDLLDKAEGAR
jgi:hypothetical protein